MENFSSRSYDESKASAYYTPTDEILSPQAPQTSPIHINYIERGCETPRSCRASTSKALTRFLFDRAGSRYNKMSRRTNRLRGGYLAEEDLAIGDLGVPFMGDYYGDAIDSDDDDDDHSDSSVPLGKRCSYPFALNASEVMPLKHPITDPVPSTSYAQCNGSSTTTNFKPRHRRQRSSATNEFYFSLEDVVSASATEGFSTGFTTAANTPRSIIKKQNSKIEFDEGNLYTALVKLEDGLDVNYFVPNSTGSTAAIKSSESMPDISKRGKTTPPLQSHGKHVILTLEAPASVK